MDKVVEARLCVCMNGTHLYMYVIEKHFHFKFTLIIFYLWIKSGL